MFSLNIFCKLIGCSKGNSRQLTRPQPVEIDELVRKNMNVFENFDL